MRKVPGTLSPGVDDYRFGSDTDSVIDALEDFKINLTRHKCFGQLRLLVLLLLELTLFIHLREFGLGGNLLRSSERNRPAIVVTLGVVGRKH